MYTAILILHFKEHEHYFYQHFVIYLHYKNKWVQQFLFLIPNYTNIISILIKICCIYNNNLYLY